MLEYAGAYVWCMYLIKLTLAKNLCRSQCDLLTRYRERLGSFKCIHHLREMWKLEITQFNLNFIIGNIHLLLLVLMFRATEINFLNLTFFLNLAKLYFQNYGVKEVQGTWQFSNGRKDWKVKIKICWNLRYLGRICPAFWSSRRNRNGIGTDGYGKVGKKYYF